MKILLREFNEPVYGVNHKQTYTIALLLLPIEQSSKGKNQDLLEK